MFEYINGEIVEISPSFVIIETSGIGYFINISLTTFEKIQSLPRVKLFLYQLLREDTNELYGFADKYEREIFKHLISVSGIGANTARLMLSSLSPSEIVTAILEGDVPKIKSVKGIGLKTAQRVIVDLKDKVGKTDESDTLPFVENKNIEIVNEAISALTMLGFNRKQAEKKLKEMLKKENFKSVEDLVKAGIRAMSK